MVHAMTPRRGATASRKAAAARGDSERAKAKSAKALSAGDKLTAVERERDALRLELERSEARIQELEKAQAHVRDRIAWALDSLHNILQGKG
jgi:hypothetical protein